ncbi:putative RNA-directed DNA polymerase from transposon BS [Trichonephila clavipes]|uniref:Putative RNA-directed DNA polymerase from transposon BS n=1 Tax=Trichonephila clavipes TaxID=2585209 RepID=A0A8X6V3N5_TRICX|nr:putative RNA-directed DNA polymerase from transposon BS [Trichonephila clavipes]
MSRLTFKKADKNTERQAKLAVHKCRSSDLGVTFNKADKNTEMQAKLAVHKCRSSDLGDLVFLADFSMHELLLVLNALDPKKSPGPDNIHGVMITHLGPSGAQRLLDIFNQSWKSGRLPHEWKRATIIQIRKPGNPLRVINRLL